MEKDISCKQSKESQSGYINILDKVDFRAKKITRDGGGHYTTIKE